jgi:hypothetical protein
MARNITTAFTNEVDANVLSPFIAVHLAFSDEVNMWTGYGEITFGGKTYLGMGNFLGVSIGSETTELKASGVDLSLSGISSEFVSLSLNEDYQGNAAQVYFGVLDSSGAVVADPYMVFEGRMDVMSLSDGGQTSSISLSAEAQLIDLERSGVRRYTPQDQKIDYPNDTGFDFVPSVQELTVSWGRGENAGGKTSNAS